MESDYDIRLVPTLTHGRVLARKARGVALGLLVGFHGYMEDADIQMQRLEAIPDGSNWTLVSIQAPVRQNASLESPLRRGSPAA